jgi:DNA-binding MarR family transcriptional regulator
MKGLDTEEQAQLHALDQALRFARAELNPDVTAQRLLILICVFFNQGLSQRELLSKLESTSITALSRNLADLSAWTTKKTEGPGLIELRSDPMNLRIKRVYLTRKGEGFVRRWLKATAKASSRIGDRPGSSRAAARAP